MTIGYVEAVAPPLLEHVAEQQRARHPDDGDVLDRLLRYLERTRPLLADIKASVCEFYAINATELRRLNDPPRVGRTLEVAFARQVFCYLAYKYTRFSMVVIGAHIGRHHTTVLHGIRKIEKMAAKKPLMADDLDLLRLRIAEKMMLRSQGRA